MVSILNLRTAPDGGASRSESPSSAQDDVTSPPPLSLKESIIQGLKGSKVQVPGSTKQDEVWKYTKTIPTSE